MAQTTLLRLNASPEVLSVVGVGLPPVLQGGNADEAREQAIRAVKAWGSLDAKALEDYLLSTETFARWEQVKQAQKPEYIPESRLELVLDTEDNAIGRDIGLLIAQHYASVYGPQVTRVVSLDAIDDFPRALLWEEGDTEGIFILRGFDVVLRRLPSRSLQAAISRISGALKRDYPSPGLIAIGKRHEVQACFDATHILGISFPRFLSL